MALTRIRKERNMDVDLRGENYNFIVGIGASAGGPEALQRLFAALPSDTGFPYVIVQRLSPDYESLLGAILSNYTAMPVLQVENGMKPEANHVYIMGPGRVMRIEDGTMRLSVQHADGANMPIDIFLASLAQDAGEKAIALLLSGGGTDGIEGLKAVKKAGGTVIAQDPLTAYFDALPRAAVRTGLVDAQMSPEEMAQELSEVSVLSAEKLDGEKLSFDSEILNKICALLSEHGDIDFTSFRRITLLRRLEYRMEKTKTETLEEYLGLLYSSPEELRTLLSELITGLKTLFRDPEFFMRMKHTVMETRLLEQFMPSCIVVNEQDRVMHTYGEITNYLRVPALETTDRLDELLTEGLKPTVFALLKDCRRKSERTLNKDVRFNGEQGNAAAEITVVPIRRSVHEVATIWAIVLDERTERVKGIPDAESDTGKALSRRIADLEWENAELRSKLDQSDKEREKMNAELQNTDEELQNFHEELQVANEELYSVKSEYHKMMLELAELNDDIANFQASAMSGIIFVDSNLNIRRYTAYVTSEFSIMDYDIGHSLSFISYHFPKVDITKICRTVLETLRPDEREIVTSGGKTFFMRVAPYRSAAESSTGCVITLMDISAKKRGQAVARDAAKRLTLVQRTSDAKSDFLSDVMRELRAPAESLLQLIDTTKRHIDDKETLVMGLNGITDAVSRVTSIVSGISEALLGERAADVVLEEVFAPRVLLDNIYLLMEPGAKAARVNCRVIAEDSLAQRYMGDRTKLQQILVDFLTFCLKRSKPGGEITLRALETQKQGGKAFVRFIVSDNGAVIKKENLPKLFRSDGGNVAFGAKQGLTAAYELLASMRGNVSAESKASRGTAFTIDLELTCGEESTKDERTYKMPEKFDLHGLNVLIAEDNAINLKMLEAFLTNDGITFVSTEDGEAAVRAFTEAPEGTFGCVVMDILMPKLDGIEAARQIRATNRDDAKTVPIIAVSANGAAIDISRARQSGIDDYLVKPIDRAELLRAMEKHIKRG